MYLTRTYCDILDWIYLVDYESQWRNHLKSNLTFWFQNVWGILDQPKDYHLLKKYSVLYIRLNLLR